MGECRHFPSTWCGPLTRDLLYRVSTHDSSCFCCYESFGASSTTVLRSVGMSWNKCYYVSMTTCQRAVTQNPCSERRFHRNRTSETRTYCFRQVIQGSQVRLLVYLHKLHMHTEILYMQRNTVLWPSFEIHRTADLWTCVQSQSGKKPKLLLPFFALLM